MAPTEQAMLHSHMTDWASLTPQQRIQARLSFGQTQQLPADEKRAKWEAYQSLSAQDKQRLAAEASPRPPGAAPAVKPVSPKKLALAPVVPRPVASAGAGTQARHGPRIAVPVLRSEVQSPVSRIHY